MKMEAVNSAEAFEHLFRNQKANDYLITSLLIKPVWPGAHSKA